MSTTRSPDLVVSDAPAAHDVGPTPIEPELTQLEQPTQDEGTGGHRRTELAVLGVGLVPFVVSAVALVFAVGYRYLPVADHALTELQIRDVGHHPVLYGLYSRADWSHPGPLLFYLTAPLYRLTGGASISMNLAALAINGGSVLGMCLIARRLGGVPMMIATLLSCELLMRTAGAEFMHDPWVCYVTTLPYGLLIFLVWAMTRGRVWALPVAAFVATFLAQTHVGFVLLALPLFLLGAMWQIGAGRFRRAQGERPRVPWTVLLGTGVLLVVLWLPPLIDIVVHDPGNLFRITHWFQRNDDVVHSAADGVRIMSAQLVAWPEWMTRKVPSGFNGEPRAIGSSHLPVLLGLVALAGALLWRRRPAARSLIAVLAASLVLGVVAIARTAGPAFDYRLRWTWIVPMIGLAFLGWAGWEVGAHRFGQLARRGLGAIAAAALVVVVTVNTITAARAGSPQRVESAAMATLTPEVLDALRGIHGPVLLEERYSLGAWFTQGLVLQLERHGIRVVVPRSQRAVLGKRRVYRGGRLGARLLVGQDQQLDGYDHDPLLGRIAYWTTVSDATFHRYERNKSSLDARRASGEIDFKTWLLKSFQADEDIRKPGGSLIAYRVGVYLEQARRGT